MSISTAWPIVHWLPNKYFVNNVMSAAISEVFLDHLATGQRHQQEGKYENIHGQDFWVEADPNNI